MTPASIIRLLREYQGERKQADLAADLGVTPQFISDIFKGRRMPGPRILEKLGIEKVVDYKRKNTRED